ncbi:MAG: BON domain-containing protein [Betaproteobacteria bacterium]
MKTKFIAGLASLVAAGALMLPLSGNAADSAKTYVKDSVITTKVKAELAKEKFSTLFKIDVDTTAAGDVRLTGNAPDQASIDRAVTVTKAVKGVTSVENNLVIKPAK